MSSINPNSNPGTWEINKGFTLLEVLIALALLSLVVGALYGTYFSISAGREAAVGGMEERRELRETLDRLRREISATYYKKPVNGKKNLFHFVVEDRDNFGKPASTLTFTALAPPREDQPVSDIVDVSYQPLAKEGKFLLTRQAKDVYLNIKPNRYPQMEQLESFLVECYDGSKWVKSWDDTINNGLPTMLKVTIAIKDGGRVAEFTSIATIRIAP